MFAIRKSKAPRRDVVMVQRVELSDKLEPRAELGATVISGDVEIVAQTPKMAQLLKAVQTNK